MPQVAKQTTRVSEVTTCAEPVSRRAYRTAGAGPVARRVEQRYRADAACAGPQRVGESSGALRDGVDGSPSGDDDAMGSHGPRFGHGMDGIRVNRRGSDSRAGSITGGKCISQECRNHRASIVD